MGEATAVRLRHGPQRCFMYFSMHQLSKNLVCPTVQLLLGDNVVNGIVVAFIASRNDVVRVGVMRSSLRAPVCLDMQRVAVTQHAGLLDEQQPRVAQCSTNDRSQCRRRH